MKELISAVRIQQRIDELAVEVRAAYDGKPLTVVGVLTGSLIFLADLARRVEIPLRIGLVSASSYRGTTTSPGDLHIDTALLPEVRGRHVLLLDDILDSGRTMRRLVDHIGGMGVASIKVAVLLRKIGRQVEPLEPDFIGFTIPDAFVVGYGLDFNDEYRHLPHIAELDESETHA